MPCWLVAHYKMLGLTRRYVYSQAQRWRQDCWFTLILLIMFSLSHHNLWMGTMLPREGVLWSQQAWRLLCCLSLCWLSGWTKLMEFSRFCHLCFCPPLKDDRIQGNDKHQWGSFMTETKPGRWQHPFRLWRQHHGTSACSCTKRSSVSLSEVPSGSRKAFLLLQQAQVNSYKLPM